MKAWQSECRAACQWLVTAGALVLAGLAVGDAEAQDQAKDATAKGMSISTISTGTNSAINTASLIPIRTG